MVVYKNVRFEKYKKKISPLISKPMYLSFGGSSLMTKYRGHSSPSVCVENQKIALRADQKPICHIPLIDITVRGVMVFKVLSFSCLFYVSGSSYNPLVLL